MAEQPSIKITASAPAYYVVVVAGAIGPGWVDHFGGMELASGGPGETRLSGQLRDQAELQGVLERLHGLNIPILSVLRMEGDGATSESKNSVVREEGK